MCDELFLQSDVLVFPSEWYEVSPMVIQEAYGYGLPVLATRIGSIPEHIKENETGWLFEYRNPDELAEKIMCIYESREKVKIMQEKCFESAINNTYEVYIEKIKKRQDEIINEYHK